MPSGPTSSRAGAPGTSDPADRAARKRTKREGAAANERATAPDRAARKAAQREAKELAKAEKVSPDRAARKAAQREAKELAKAEKVSPDRVARKVAQREAKELAKAEKVSPDRVARKVARREAKELAKAEKVSPDRVARKVARREAKELAKAEKVSPDRAARKAARREAKDLAKAKKESPDRAARKAAQREAKDLAKAKKAAEREAQKAAQREAKEFAKAEKAAEREAHKAASGGSHGGATRARGAGGAVGIEATQKAKIEAAAAKERAAAQARDAHKAAQREAKALANAKKAAEREVKERAKAEKAAEREAHKAASGGSHGGATRWRGGGAADLEAIQKAKIEAAAAKERAAAQARDAHKAAQREAKALANAKKAAEREVKERAKAEKAAEREAHKAAGGGSARRRDRQPPPPVPMPPRRLRRLRRRARTGIEVDGTTVRVVEMDGSEIVWFHAYEESSATRALDQWRWSVRYRSKRPSIIWAGGRTHFLQLDVPDIPERALSEYVAVNAATELPLDVEDYAIAAVDVGREDGIRTMSVTTVERVALDDLWNFLIEASADIVPSEFTLGTDGLFLEARDSGAVLVLVEDGVPSVGRELTCGGLDRLKARLEEAADDDGAGPADMVEGPGGALHSPGQQPNDQKARARSLVGAYIQALVSEVRNTIEFWQSRGISVPSEVRVRGSGAALPSLHDRFEAASVHSSAAPPPAGVTNLEVLPDTHRIAYYGAIGAVVNQPDLTVTIANPLVTTAKAKARLARQRVLLAAGAAAVVGLVVWQGVVPVIRSNQAADRATAEWLATSEELSGVPEAFVLLEEVLAVGDSVDALHQHEPNWEVVLEAIFVTAPAGTTFLSLSLDSGPCTNSPLLQSQAVPPEAEPAPSCIYVAMDAYLPEQDLLLAAEWIRNFESVSGFGVVPGSLTVSSDDEERAASPLHVAFTLRFPNEGAYRIQRLLPGGGG